MKLHLNEAGGGELMTKYRCWSSTIYMQERFHNEANGSMSFGLNARPGLAGWLKRFRNMEYDICHKSEREDQSSYVAI